MGNMDIWNQFRKVPPERLKRISGGRLNGKSDVNPQWRIQAMTEAFGPCGVGWKWVPVRMWTEHGDGVEVFVFVHLELYFKAGMEWSEAIPGVGGNKLVVQEKSAHNNDEAYKMAVTDALGTAMKMLGVAAEVYLGNWDGSKYINQEPEAPTSPPAPGTAAFGSNGPKPPAADAPPAGKVFSWPKATSEERKTYTIGRIEAAKAERDPVKFKESLGKISKFLSDKGGQLTPEHWQEVSAALQAAEQVLMQELSGA